MEIYIGIGFVILCLSILVFVVALFNYTLKITKKELDVSPPRNTSRKTTHLD